MNIKLYSLNVMGKETVSTEYLPQRTSQETSLILCVPSHWLKKMNGQGFGAYETDERQWCSSLLNHG